MKSSKSRLGKPTNNPFPSTNKQMAGTFGWKEVWEKPHPTATFGAYRDPDSKPNIKTKQQKILMRKSNKAKKRER